MTPSEEALDQVLEDLKQGIARAETQNLIETVVRRVVFDVLRQHGEQVVRTSIESLRKEISKDALIERIYQDFHRRTSDEYLANSLKYIERRVGYNDIVTRAVDVIARQVLADVRLNVQSKLPSADQVQEIVHSLAGEHLTEQVVYYRKQVEDLQERVQRLERQQTGQVMR